MAAATTRPLRHAARAHARSRGPRDARPGESDVGSISTFFVVAVLALLLVAGLVSDGAGRVQALQRADNAAAEAARAAGQALSPETVASGRPGNLDATAAAAAARTYLSAAGVEGSVRSSSVPTPAGTQISITVTTTTRHDPLFVGIPGTLTGTATARVVQGTS